MSEALFAVNRCLAKLERQWSAAEVETIARICHEANRAMCIVAGDFSQSSWDDAEEWQKESCREGVRKQLESCGTNPQENHDSWLGLKLRAGWRYGPVKDFQAKIHPCLLPWGELSEFEKTKDRIFVAIVGAFRNKG